MMSEQPAWRTNLAIPCGHEHRLYKTARFVRRKSASFRGNVFGAMMLKADKLPQSTKLPYGSKS